MDKSKRSPSPFPGPATRAPQGYPPQGPEAAEGAAVPSLGRATPVLSTCRDMPTSAENCPRQDQVPPGLWPSRRPTQRGPRN